MRTIRTVSFLWLLMIAMASPAFAINLNLNNSVSGHHDYLLLAEDKEYCENYLLVNTKSHLFGETRTFAVLDLDLQFMESSEENGEDTAEEINYEVNEAYLGIRLLENVTFTFGKKRILWGVAFAYNPTGFVEGPVSPFDPDLKQGVYSSELSYFHHAYSLDYVLVFSGQPENFGHGLKLSLYSLFPQTDLSLMGYYAKEDGLNMGMSLESTPFTTPFWRDLALYGEIGLVQSSFSRPQLSGDDFYQRWLVGVRYVHPGTETAVLFEYIYLEDGFSQEERKQLLQQQPWLNLPGPSARRSIFFNIQRPALTKNQYPFTDTLSLAARAFRNLEDESMLLMAAITSELIKDTQISLEGTWYVGKDETEYASLPIERVYSLVFRVDF